LSALCGHEVFVPAFLEVALRDKLLYGLGYIVAPLSSNNLTILAWPRACNAAVLKNVSFFNLSETLTGAKAFLPAARLQHAMICKVVLCGPGGVGKTSLARRLVGEEFNPRERVTVGIAHFTRRVSVGGRELTLMIWDIGGEDRFRFLAPLFLRGARVVVYVFDVSRYETFAEMDEWKRIVEEVAGRVPGVLVGNKVDRSRVVGGGEAEGYARVHGLEYVETSAATGEGVAQLLEKIARLAASVERGGSN
jgi:small GTP-binding protein